MEFVHFLSSHMLQPTVGGKQLFRDTIEQAVHAEALGYRGVAIPEHHLVNILLIPSPLQMAVKIAAHTKHIKLMTSVCQLPLRDMRVFAGEVVQAQALCDGRLMLGVGKGAFDAETRRMGVPIETTKPIFEESLQVLEALLTHDGVSWNGTHYKFSDVTIMPRPEDPIPLMVGVMVPAGIEAAAAKGYHIQTTPLGGSHQQLQEQVSAYVRGRARAPVGSSNRLALQRGIYLVKDEAHRKRMVETAHQYYKSFDNVFGGAGLVDKGIIRPLDRAQSAEELGQNILILERNALIDKLGVYAQLGIDEVLVTSVFGQPQSETLEMMECLAKDVFPHFVQTPVKAA